MARTHPIVLAHGIARFDGLLDLAVDVDNEDELDGFHYFKNIRTHLKSHGFEVWHTQVDWAGSVSKRAGDLKRGIEAILASTGARRVHIIAHSMGGLDARHALFEYRQQRFHEKVASVTTIATPHHGSPVADFVLDPFSFLIRSGLEAVAAGESAASSEDALAELRRSEEFRAFARTLEIDPDRFGVVPPAGLETADFFSGVAGVRDLTTEATSRFNAVSLEWERTTEVSFQAFAGAEPREDVFAPLRFPWKIVQSREGDNDGLVSVRSATWTDEIFVRTLRADHLNELGWWPDVRDPGERARRESESKAFYLGLAEELATRARA